jgi:hypothetical protein
VGAGENQLASRFSEPFPEDGDGSSGVVRIHAENLRRTFRGNARREHGDNGECHQYAQHSYAEAVVRGVVRDHLELPFERTHSASSRLQFRSGIGHRKPGT